MSIPIYNPTIDPSRVEWFSDQPQVPVYNGPEDIDFTGLSILDVGCGTGKDLLHIRYAGAKELCGIDPSEDRIGFGRARYPTLNLSVGYAESLPYPDGRFDFVVSRVTLPLANIPVALKEIARVTRPGGVLVLTMHDYRIQLWRWWRALKQGEWKTVADAPYVLLASTMCCLGFEVPARPWKGTRTTFQSSRCLKRLLARAGFVDAECRKEPGYFIAQAKKP